MTQKILFFTANRTATNPELLLIETLRGLAEQPYEIVVMSNEYGSNEYGEGRPVPADFVAGTVPADYKDGETPIYPVFDPENPPVVLPDTKAIVSDGDSYLTSSANGTVNVEVAENAISLEFTPAAANAIVSNGVALVVPVTGVYATTATPTIVDGVVTGIVLS